MKKNKLIIFILFFLLMSPILVNAEVCNKNDIKIESIELNELKGNAEETSSSNNENNQINVNAKMNVVGDSLTYKVVMKNTSNSDYIFDQNQITKDYINYDISYGDDSSIIKAGEEKTIYLRLNYQNKPQVENLTNGILTENNKVSFNLINETGKIINPKTKNKIIVALIITTLSIGFTILLTKRRKKLIVSMMIISLLVIPKIVNAICTCTLDINLNLEIDTKEATFLPGQEVNIKMKQLAGDDTSTITDRYKFENHTISSIKYSEQEPVSINKEGKNIVSINESPYPIYMWYENNTIYWWSEDETPSLNEDASYMYYNFYELKELSGLETFDTTKTKQFIYLICNTKIEELNNLRKWDTSNVTNMDSLLVSNYNLESIKGLENWDTSNVTNMRRMFQSDISINDFTPIKDWNVKKVKSMVSMFSCCFNVEEIDLSNWETPSLEEIADMFAQNWLRINGEDITGGKIKRIILSDKFDTSKVKSMDLVFYNNRVIEDYSFIKYINTSNVTTLDHTFYANHNLKNTDDFKDWNVSKVTNMTGTFIGTKSLTSLEGLKNWDTSSVTSMTYMFRHSYALTSLKGLENWNVSSVTNYAYMFDGISNLSETNDINNWNIQKTATFTRMFGGTQTHPEFTKIEGTWNNQGTFIPN